MQKLFMKRAIELAELGMGHVSPNPMVGCVIVKNDRIISEGYHEKYGEFHAERNALLRCEDDTTGAQAYVTLEPCCHHGKTPPCTEILIEKGIKKVYIGSADPNPLVAGKGVKLLREHGIEVVEGVLRSECDQMNEIFFHYITKKTPFVAMKYAMTLDGKIACASGDSKWVTSEASRHFVQKLRKQYSGIMVGIGTVLCDDPMLNCRIEEGVDPIRIICDSKLRIPLDSQIVKTADKIPTIVAYTQFGASDSVASGIKPPEFLVQEMESKKQQLMEAGITLLEAGNDKGQISLKNLMEQLGSRKIDSVLLEGGGTLNASALQEGIVNKVYAFVAPKLVGGMGAKSPVEGVGVSKMSDAFALKGCTMHQFGEDFCLEGRLLV